MNEATAGKILDFLVARRDEMVGLLTRCALLESPSADPETHDAVFDVLSTELATLDFRCKRLSGSIASRHPTLLRSLSETRIVSARSALARFVWQGVNNHD